MKSDSRLH